MTAEGPLLAIIPARGGSKGIPGKNIRPFAGLPLIAHSIAFANICPEIHRCVVSTDSAEIADVARRYGGDVPFLRPVELAQDETPMWPVIRHALERVEQGDSVRYAAVLLLDPTSPARHPADVSQMRRRLSAEPSADGVVSVSQPRFNPLWHCVREHAGVMVSLIAGAEAFQRRQDVPTVYWINGALYLWHASFVRREVRDWRSAGKHLLYETPDASAMSLDTPHEFALAELLVKSGVVEFPWLREAAHATGA